MNTTPRLVYQRHGDRIFISIVNQQGSSSIVHLNLEQAKLRGAELTKLAEGKAKPGGGGIG